MSNHVFTSKGSGRAVPRSSPATARRLEAQIEADVESRWERSGRTLPGPWSLEGIAASITEPDNGPQEDGRENVKQPARTGYFVAALARNGGSRQKARPPRR